MALNQSVKLIAGLKLEAVVESPAEPGQPRQYFDGTKAAMVADHSARVDVAADPTMPEVYLVQAPTSATKAMKDGLYRVTLLNPSQPPGQQVADQFDVMMVDGDDGYQGYPSAEIPVWGTTFRVWGAKNLLAAPAH